MQGTLTYRRSGNPPAYSVFIEIELPQSQEPKVHITRYREESYVSGGGCGSCGYQTPVQVYRRVVSQSQSVSGAQVQVGRWVYQIADIRSGDVVRIERYKANKIKEMVVYTATSTAFTSSSPTSNTNGSSLQITLVNGDQPAPTVTKQKSHKWWHQAGVLRVRNGFAVQGLVAIPIPQIDAPQQRLLQSITTGKQVKEPASLN